MQQLKSMTKTEVALKLVGKAGGVRPKDLVRHGIAPVYLRCLLNQGSLVQAARGVYRFPRRKPGSHHDPAVVSEWIPHGAVCWLSALHFHGLFAEPPGVVWLATGRKAGRPTIEGPLLRVARFSEVSFGTGVERHTIEGGSVAITSPVKSVVGGNRYCGRIGFDTALDALRECRRRRKSPVDEILKYSKACRVESIIRPSLEALA